MKGFAQNIINIVAIILPFSASLTSVAYGKEISSSDEEAISLALTLAKAERFDTALDRLSKLNIHTENSYEVRFAKARILTWAQRYPEAELHYNYLMTHYPSHPDIQVSYGYLNLFRGDLDSAEAHFISVIEQHPDYDDAHRGLERTKASHQE